MSLFFVLVLIAISWVMSAFVTGMAHFWHVFSITPLWFMGAIAIGLLAWFVSEP
jgi:hypothetical protein